MLDLSLKMDLSLLVKWAHVIVACVCVSMVTVSAAEDGMSVSTSVGDLSSRSVTKKKKKVRLVLAFTCKILIHVRLLCTNPCLIILRFHFDGCFLRRLYALLVE